MNKDDEKEKIEGEKRTAVEVAKPSIEKRIKELNDEIQQTKIDLAENNVQTGFQFEKHIMYAGLTIVLSFYLLFFYASAIYASFFRNAGTILKLAGDDIASLKTVSDIPHNSFLGLEPSPQFHNGYQVLSVANTFFLFNGKLKEKN